MRMSAGFCITGWLAVYFSHVCVLSAHFDFSGLISSVNQLDSLIGYNAGSLVSRYGEAFHRIRNWSLLLCGNFLILFFVAYLVMMCSNSVRLKKVD